MMKKSLAAASALTLTLLYGMLVLIAFVFSLTAGIPLGSSLIIGVLVMALQFLINPFLTDLNYKWFYKADFNWEAPPELRVFIEKVCAQNNMKYPSLGLIDDGAPNAFTYGRTKNDARIVLTRGTLELLTQEELETVVGHELGHAAHYDMLIMTVVQLVPLVLHAIGDACMKVSDSSGSSGSSGKSDNSKGGVVMVGLLAMIFYAVSELIILRFSRTREYYADEFSVEATEKPNALASALVKIGLGLSTRKGQAGAKHQTSAAMRSALGIADADSGAQMASCCLEPDGSVSLAGIRNAMKWDLWNKWAAVYELGSTHPLISKRILAISEMCAQYGQTPVITFDGKPDRDYGALFTKELFIMFLPTAVLIIGVLVSMISIAFEVPALPMLLAGLTMILASVTSLAKLNYRHKMPRKGESFPHHAVGDLLQEVDVSGMHTIPCELTGTLIGRGDPGCMFDENFVIRDDTGILFLNYDQPLTIMNKFFALFRSPGYIDRETVVRGWYRRAPVPMLEIYEIEKDGQSKRVHSLVVGRVLRCIPLVFGIFDIFLSIFVMSAFMF